MDDVVNFVRFKTENFAKSASDFVEQNHSFQGILSRILGVVLAGGDDHRVVVIVAKFSSRIIRVIGVVAEYGSVRVPLTDCRAVGSDCFLRVRPYFRAKALRYPDILSEKYINYLLNYGDACHNWLNTYPSSILVGLTEYCLMASFLRIVGALVLSAMALIPQMTESV